MFIEDKACPRCGNTRTVRVRAELSMCWNCKLQRSLIPRASCNEAAATPASVPPDTVQARQLEHPFTPRELRRLVYYRAALAAGFYTDGLGSHENVAAMGEELPADEQPRQSAYPFTRCELRRLIDYRAAVRAGLYTDALASYANAAPMGWQGG
jgi:hypothetical protein